MREPLRAVHWAPIRSGFVRFFAIPGEDWPGADLPVLGQALGLSKKQYKRARREIPGNRRKMLCRNRNGEIRPAIIGSASAVAGLFYVARAVGKSGVDEAERAFGEAFETAAALMRQWRAA